MKKIIPFIIIGAVVGALSVTIFWSRFLAYHNKTERMIRIGGLENLVFEVYKTGDVEASIVALSHLIPKLRWYEAEMDPQDSDYETIVTDLGLSYARLFLLYEAKGSQKLADQKYQEAIKLIGERFKVDSKGSLRELIKQIDISAQKEILIEDYKVRVSNIEDALKIYQDYSGMAIEDEMVYFNEREEYYYVLDPLSGLTCCKLFVDGKLYGRKYEETR